MKLQRVVWFFFFYNDEKFIVRSCSNASIPLINTVSNLSSSEMVLCLLFSSSRKLLFRDGKSGNFGRTFVGVCRFGGVRGCIAFWSTKEDELGLSITMLLAVSDVAASGTADNERTGGCARGDDTERSLR